MVRNGILVSDMCRTDDPAIYAIGDCARTPAAARGWSTPAGSRRASSRTTWPRRSAAGPDPRPVLGADSGVFRVKAEGLEAVTMGEFPADEFAPGAPRVLSLTDPVGRRRVRVAVADGPPRGRHVRRGSPGRGRSDGGVRLTDACPRRPGRPAGPPSPARPRRCRWRTCPMPPSRRCNAVTKAAITDAVKAGADTPEAVATATRALHRLRQLHL